jgi:hypothetical protein
MNIDWAGRERTQPTPAENRRVRRLHRIRAGAIALAVSRNPPIWMDNPMAARRSGRNANRRMHQPGR